eukprot:gnl/MRDRNA2_/MRDRNA2_117620_c0_seq1.p2 gnl/MRDRNA2_/MRDRNA2_117620_c0~~gnl/MRDRNA2_/MRDRNA2_117620_c0_seq1.p2  ORF type:complete len:130 (+),score=33.24 gnl/MRDRNA2_/MRDRNA2_117620_c0_seq1:75-464(+)
MKRGCCALLMLVGASALAAPQARFLQKNEVGDEPLSQLTLGKSQEEKEHLYNPDEPGLPRPPKEVICPNPAISEDYKTFVKCDIPQIFDDKAPAAPVASAVDKAKVDGFKEAMEGSIPAWMTPWIYTKN